MLLEIRHVIKTDPRIRSDLATILQQPTSAQPGYSTPAPAPPQDIDAGMLHSREQIPYEPSTAEPTDSFHSKQPEVGEKERKKESYKWPLIQQSDRPMLQSMTVTRVVSLHVKSPVLHAKNFQDRGQSRHQDVAVGTPSRRTRSVRTYNGRPSQLR